MRLVFCCVMILLTVAGMTASAFFYRKKCPFHIKGKYLGNIWFWIAVACAVRLLFSFLFAFYPKSTHTDIMFWIDWSRYLGTNSLSGFYAEGVGDYTPIFPYYLKAVGMFLHHMGLPNDGVIASVLYKLFPITGDAVSGILIYYCAGKERGIELANLFLWNPAVIFLSVVWGQVDINYAVVIALSAYCLAQRKIVLSGALTAFGLLIKLQTMFWGPIYIVGILCYLFKEGYTWKKMREVLLTAAVSLGVLVIGCLPFGIMNTLNQCVFTLSEDPVASINAANFWTLLGLNFVPQSNTFLGIPYIVWGYLAIALSSFFCMFLVWKNWEKKETLYLYTGVLFLLIFTFSARMRERYSFPALLMLLLAYGINAEWKYLYWYVIFSITSFVNQAIVILIAKYYNVFDGILWVTSLVTVAGTVWMLGWCIKSCLKSEKVSVKL